MNLEELKEKLLNEIKQQMEKERPPTLYETWTPAKPGDHLFGKVKSIRVVNTRFGERKIIDVEDWDNNKQVSVWLTTILEKKLEELKVKESDVVMIVYGGAVRTNTGKVRYHLWYVAKVEDKDVKGLEKEIKKKREQEKEVKKEVKEEKDENVKEKEEPREEKKEEKKQEISKEDMMKQIEVFVNDLFEFYDEIPLEHFERYIKKVKKFDVDINEVIEKLNLKVEEGKVKKK